jgi:hypothetical protein
MRPSLPHRGIAGHFVQLFHPSHKRVYRSMGRFLVLSALYFVQDFVSLVDSRAKLLLASKAPPLIEIPDDAPILEM